MNVIRTIVSLTLTALLLSSCAARPAVSDSADNYVLGLARDYAGLITHRIGAFPDQTPEVVSGFYGDLDDIAKRLGEIKPQRLSDDEARLTYDLLKEDLTTRQALRVCRQELWNVNHIQGWQVELAGMAEAQAVATTDERQQVLLTWERLPGFVDIELRNLRQGLMLGYSAPQSVVRRVIMQLDSLLAQRLETSPLNSPAQRSGDAAFVADYRELMATRVFPSIRRYRDYGARIALTADPVFRWPDDPMARSPDGQIFRRPGHPMSP